LVEIILNFTFDYSFLVIIYPPENRSPLKVNKQKFLALIDAVAYHVYTWGEIIVS